VLLKVLFLFNQVCPDLRAIYDSGIEKVLTLMVIKKLIWRRLKQS